MQKKSFETILYSVVGVIIMAVVLIAFNVLTGAVHRRVDLTDEKAFTLSKGTRAVLAGLDTPVKIRFYCSQTDSSTPLAVFLKSHAKKVEDLLAEYRQAAGGKLIIEKYDPQPDSDAEDSARLDGMQAQQMPGGGFYLGLAVNVVDVKESIPFLRPDRERQLEYDISRAISRAIKPEKATVGVMSPLPVFGMPANPMMMQMGQRGQEPWALIGELRNDFTVKNVAMDVDRIDDDIKVLFVIHPKEISDQAQYAIDQFILRGGKLVAFLDTQSLVDSRGQNPMMGGMPGGGSSLEKLIKAWGLEFDTSKVVADREFKMQLGEPGEPSRERPAWLALNPAGINAEDIATGELDNIWFFSGGAFTGTPVPGLKETVLLKSSKESQLVDGIMASFGAEGILKDFKPSGTEYALAIRLTGKFKTAFPEGKPGEPKLEAGTNPEDKSAPKVPDNSLKESREENTVILVGDADMISDGFTLRRMNTPFGVFAEPMNANLSFAQNVIEQLSGDHNLVAVRSRALLSRPLTRVKALQAQAEAKYMARVREVQESQNQAINRINELEQQKGQNQRFILSKEQRDEIENLRRKEAEAGRDLRKLQKDLRRDVKALEDRVKWSNILIMPTIVSLVGITLAIYKRKLTSAK